MGRDRHFTWSSEPCRAKVVPSFLSYFKTLSIGPTPGIEPTTFPSTVKHSTNWANPAMIKIVCLVKPAILYDLLPPVNKHLLLPPLNNKKCLPPLPLPQHGICRYSQNSMCDHLWQVTTWQKRAHLKHLNFLSQSFTVGTTTTCKRPWPLFRAGCYCF